MSNKMFRRKVFWNDCSQEYCDLTHLHGFKEFSLSSYKFEKVFWILIILGAFTFTGFLIFKSLQDALNEKRKQTFVNYEKYGNVSLPLMYCPNDWVDLNKIKFANISEHYVLYSLSYLRNLRSTYLDEKDFHFIYQVNVTSVQFCNNSNNNEEELPEMLFLAPFIETKCIRDRVVPDYYGNLSRLLISFMRITTKVVDSSIANLMAKLFIDCQNNKYDEVWKSLYYQFPLSLSARASLLDIGKRFLNDGEILKKIIKCGFSKFALFLTLHDVDNLNNERHIINCDKFSKIESDLNHSQLCSIYNDAIIFYMFHSGVLRYFFLENFNIYDNFDKKRSNVILEIISANKNYSDYLQRTLQNGSYETFKKYINNEIGGSFHFQNSKLTEIRNRVEEEFKNNERNDFYQYLKDKNFTVFDIFKSISFDENKFLLGMSIDYIAEIRPRYGTIDVEKIINCYGVCYLFEIKADMKPVIELPNTINDIDRRHKIHEKLYINIVELRTGPSMQVRTGPNILVIGSESKNLIPSQNSFDIEGNSNWRFFDSFEISNLAYQSRRGAIECHENKKNQHEVTYTYNNCIADCFNVYSQPKYIDGFPQQKANCEYITESLLENNKSEHCSFFSKIINETPLRDFIIARQKLDICNVKCLIDCEWITLNIRPLKVDCFKDSLYGGCRRIIRAPHVKMYEGEKMLMLNYYENLSNNRSSVNSARPIWMKPYKYEDFNIHPNVADMINEIESVYAPQVARMEFQINSDVTTYETSQSLEWYSYLGVVGGQINLIVSGSLLTVFQLIWWCLQYFYRHYYRMTKPSTIRKQDLSVMSSLLDIHITGVRNINGNIHNGVNLLDSYYT